jgi:hypothetical protein
MVMSAPCAPLKESRVPVSNVEVLRISPRAAYGQYRCAELADRWPQGLQRPRRGWC